MSLPLFSPTDDPGSSFTALLRKLDLLPVDPVIPVGAAAGLAHGTTIAAMRYVDGVLMAGDRRATQGNSIAHRMMEKVHPADRFSGVAFAGTAGFAMEMVKAFQLELEHYEKLNGTVLSLEGKANMLSRMVRDHLGMAMQGLAVIPLFAGYDTGRRMGRIWTYDPTGGRYEEADFQADGSGGRDARTTIKLGWRRDMDKAAAIELAVEALYEAADEDSATGGPDTVRGIYPTVAVITAAGYEDVAEDEVSTRFAALIERRSSRGGTPL